MDARKIFVMVPLRYHENVRAFLRCFSCCPSRQERSRSGKRIIKNAIISWIFPGIRRDLYRELQVCFLAGEEGLPGFFGGVVFLGRRVGVICYCKEKYQICFFVLC